MTNELLPSEGTRKRLCVRFLRAFGEVVDASGLMYTEVYAVHKQYEILLGAMTKPDAAPPIKVELLIALQRVEDCVRETAEEWLKEKPLQTSEGSGKPLSNAEATGFLLPMPRPTNY